MTDFFNGLIARSFGVETGVRPRVASLFESVRAWSPTPQQLTSPQEQVFEIRHRTGEQHDLMHRGHTTHLPPHFDEESVPSPVAQTRIRNPRSTAPGEPGLDPNSLLPTRYSVMTGSRMEQSLITTPSAPETPKRSALAENMPAAPPVPVVPSRSRFLRAAESSVHNAPVPESNMRARTQQSAPHHEAPTAPLPRSRQAAEEDQNRTALLPSRALAEVVAQMKSAASSLRAAPPALSRRNDQGAPGTSPNDSEPTVHVTIGRIEVRATAENKPTSRRSAPSPVASLEDYLTQRREGGGR